MRRKNTHKKLCFAPPAKELQSSTAPQIRVLCTDCALLPPVKQGASHRRMVLKSFNFLISKMYSRECVIFDN